MSIASEISRLSSNISDSLDAVAAKGVTVPSDSNSDDLPGLIALIEQSSGGDSGGTIYQDTDGYLHLSEDDKNVISIVDTLDTAGGTIRTITSAVESGGGGESREDLTDPKDVDFIDFDGRLLYSYTAAEFLELTELPPNPSYPGLIAQGWNWTLEDAKEFVAEYGAQVIGQNYTTDDGKTRIYLHIRSVIPSAPIHLWFTASIANGVTIFWGDGNSTVRTATTNTYNDHTYDAPGDYVIELSVTAGEITSFGRDGASNNIVGNIYYQAQYITHIEIGDNVVCLAKNSFQGMHNLKTISVPKTLLSALDYDESLFSDNLLAFVFPQGFTTPRYRAMFPTSCEIKYISIPKSMNNFAIGTYPRHLRKLFIVNSENNVNARLYNVPSLTHYIALGTYTTIVDDTMRQSLVKKLYIPETVTSISATAFAYNYYCEEIHLLPTTPPNLSSTNAFTYIGREVTGGCVFYVPYSSDHSILEAYQTATNWSTYASQMQEEPQ